MTAGRVLAVGAGFALNVFLARRLGPISFGLFAVVATVLAWLELIVNEGLPLWLARVVGRSDEGPLVPRAYFVGQIAVSLLLAAGLAMAAPALALAFGHPSDSLLFRVAAIDIPIVASYSLFGAVLLGSRTYGLESVATSGYAIIKLVATVLLVQAGLSVLGAVVGSICGSLGGLILVLALIAFNFRGRPFLGDLRQGSSNRRAPAPSPEDAGGGLLLTSGAAVSGSVVIALLIISQSLALSVDLWLVKLLLPAADAGYYRAASLIAQVPIALSSGVVWGLYAAYNEASIRGDTKRLRHYVSQATRVLVAAGGLWAASVVPTSKALLSTMFAADYSGGAGALAALAVATAVGMLAAALAPTLIIEGRGRAVAFVAGGLVAAEIVAALLLTPRIGAMGAALSVTGAFVAASVIALWAMRDRLDFRVIPTLARLLLPAAAVAALAVAVRPAPGFGLIGWYGLFAVAYGALLFATRGLTREDVEAFRGGLE